MSLAAVLAADGGNSKTDLALVGADGGVLGFARGPDSSPHKRGSAGAIAVLAELVHDAAVAAGLAGSFPVARHAQILLAGVDFPAEEHEMHHLVTEQGWAEDVHVGNDTFAVLRAGTDRGAGVAVVCGAGINCVGVAPDGRHARFPALGAITGDWGGGVDIGLAAVSAAARSEDGRGPKTSLEQAVPAHFGLAGPAELAEALHLGQVAAGRVLELAPVVLREAPDDAVAAGIVARLADEVTAFVRVALGRLEPAEAVEVVLGGGVLQNDAGMVRSLVEASLAGERSIRAIITAQDPPIVGAALRGFDALGAPLEAKDRARRELSAAVERATAKR